MKLRIHETSVRFRIRREEAEELLRTGELRNELPFYTQTGRLEGIFYYALKLGAEGTESACHLEPFGITQVLSRREAEQLLQGDGAGVHWVRESTTEEGASYRFESVVEIDLEKHRGQKG